MPTSTDIGISARKDGSWYALRIAATLFVVLIAALIYQYATLNAGSLFKSCFTPYTISSAPKHERSSQLEKLYHSGQHDLLIERFSRLTAPGLYDRFLAANSYLIKQDPAKAIQQLQVIRNTDNLKDSILKEETDYYLAMAYLANNEAASALPLAEAIHNNHQHICHDRLSNFQLAKLKWLAGKRGI